MAKISYRILSESLTGDLIPEQVDYILAESAAEVVFAEFADARCAEYLRFEQGVAFGQAGELRWVRRQNGACHVVYISEAGVELPEAEGVAELTPHNHPNLAGQILLRGERAEGNRFVEGRIPSAFVYPVAGLGDNPRQIAVTLKHYLLYGEPLSRCTGLRGAQGGGNAAGDAA